MTSTEDRAIRERAQAEAIMENLRVRGLLKGPPAPLPEFPADEAFDALFAPEATGLADAQIVDALGFASSEQITLWTREPGCMSDADHAMFCQGGELMRGGRQEPVKCPRCVAKAQEINLRARLVAAGVDGRYLDVDWSDLEMLAPLNRLSRACERISDIIFEGQSLLLWSAETGSGKTQAAMLAAVYAVRAGHTAHVTNLARLSVEIRDGYGDKTGTALKEGQALQRLCAPKLLVIDDLGAGESDSAAIERRLLFLALDHRQMHRLPTIVTTNVEPKELAALFGARVLARLQPLTVIHVNHGKNFRATKPGLTLW